MSHKNNNGQWLIWCHERLMWWKPNRQGYCVLACDAGRYSFEEALEIVKQANYTKFNEPEESMVPVV
jgi:hypothetical protein